MRTLLSIAVVFGLTARAEPARKYELNTQTQLLVALDEAAGLKSTQCVQRMTGAFSHVILVGARATDVGCQDLGFFADGVYYPNRALPAPALISGGWKDISKRAALALTWAKEARGASFTLTKSTVTPDGAVVVEGTETYPPGMRPERVTAKQRLTFSPSGELRVETIERTVSPL